ncbi:MAG: hypothetical protein NTX33_13315 [Propionibacteriales bacterium]|nr:hypothetical protein [Propionibacteriales bacterium]
MTDQRLRDLLHEHVADLAPTDLGARAWQGARRTRQRRAAGVAGAAVATVVVVAGSLAIAKDDGGSPADPAPTPTTEQSTVGSPVVEPGADYRGAKTWWAPPSAEERNLPILGGTPLPDEIDLAPGAPAHPAGMRAVAVFELAGESGAPGRVVVVGADRTSYSLDVGRLDPVTDEVGNVFQPLGEESLAPDGRHVFFVQKSALEVYDLITGAWATYETVPWLAESARWISATEIWAPGELGSPDGTGTTYDVTGAEPTSVPTDPRVWDTSDEPFGPVRESAGGGVAQAMFLAEPATGPTGGPVGGTDALAARTGDDEVHLLVAPGFDDGRWKGCCPVVGWLDDETVLLQSRSNESRILAWRVGTPDLQRVSRLVGWEPGQESAVGSFADLR